MQLYILDSNYELLGEINEQEDIVFNKRFNDVGYCALKTACDADMLALLKRGNYIYRYDDDFFCKIETSEIDTHIEQGDYLTVTAADMNGILAGRIVRWDIVYSGTVAGFIQHLLDDNVINPAQPQRKIDNFEFDTSNFDEFTETINVAKDTATQDLLQLIMTTCKTYNYGFRVSFDIQRGKLVFRLIRGKNKATKASAEYVEFSPNFANIISSHYKEDESNFKNIVYVGYKTASGETALLSMYSGDAEPQGEERREVYIDGTNTSRDITLDELSLLFGTVESGDMWRTAYTSTDADGKVTTGYNYYTGESQLVAVSVVTTKEENGEQITEEKITATDYTYLLLIRIIGYNTLAERVRTQEFNGEVDTVNTYEYKTDFDLGDIVNVINEYGITAQAQITEVTESENAEQPYTVEPKFEYIY